MPIKREPLERRALRRQEAAIEQHRHGRKNAETEDQMNGVNARHHPVKRPEDLRLRRLQRKSRTGEKPFCDIVVIFEALDDKECAAERERGRKAPERRPPKSLVRAALRDKHGEAAGQQDGGVQRSVNDVGFARGEAEGVRVKTAVDRVTEQSAAEKQHFAGEKNPYAK